MAFERLLKRYAVSKVPTLHIDNLDSKLRELENGNRTESPTREVAPSEATGSAQSSREGVNRSNSQRPGAGQAAGAEVVTGEAKPQTPPPPKPTPPENIEVRKPGPGTIEKR
jgi:hypothetical protein